MATAEPAPDQGDAPDERPVAYVEAGRSIYRASAAGACIRALIAARTGQSAQDRNPVIVEAAAAGHRLEPQIITKVEADGWRVRDRQREVELVQPAFTIRGHVDGTVDRQGELRLLECKALGESRFRQFLRQGLPGMLEYAAQVRVYLEAMKSWYAVVGPVGVLFALGHRLKDGTLGEVVLFEIADTDVPAKFEDIRDRLLFAELQARKQQLVPCDVSAGGTEHFFCSYKYLCKFEAGPSALEETLVPALAEADLAEIATMAAECIQQTAAAKAAETRAKDLKAQLQKRLGDRRSVTAGPYRVVLKPGGRTGWDDAKLVPALTKAGLKPVDLKKRTTWDSVVVTGPGSVDEAQDGGERNG